MKAIATERNEQVLAVLRAATEPPGPTEIGRRIGQRWSTYERLHWGNSAAVTPVLRRIGAVRHAGGLYTAPEAK